MSVNVFYRTSAQAVGGRDGRASSDDGRLEVSLATPKELGGSGGAGTNPEQLFAAGYAACFLNALKYIAGQAHTPFPGDATVTANVGIGQRSEGEGYGLTVDLAVFLPGFEQDAAQALVEKGHQVCPYSNATRGNIDVKLAVSV